MKPKDEKPVIEFINKKPTAPITNKEKNSSTTQKVLDSHNVYDH